MINSPLHVPIVPVLWSPPPVTRVTNITPPVNDVVGPSLLTDPPNVDGSSLTVSGEGAVEACMGLVNKIPSSHTGTPRPLSQPDSTLAVDHARSVPMTQPPSCATTPLRPNTFVTGQEGPAALMKVMSQSHQPGSATASPELLFGSSQEDGSQKGDTYENFQSSDASQIHGMTLRYSDSDEVADKEMRQLNLQDAAHTYMMEHDAQDSITPVPFQDPKSPSQLIETDDRYIPDGQNTRLSQVAQKQLAYLPDGSSGFRLQILYLQQFFGTNWFFVHKNTLKLFAIYDAVYFETTCCAQSQLFNLVTLDEDLQDLLQDRTR